MLSYSTVESHTLELLKAFMQEELFASLRLVGCCKYPEHSLFRALLSLSYFEDADAQMMPVMFSDIDWSIVKKRLSDAVKRFQ